MTRKKSLSAFLHFIFFFYVGLSSSCHRSLNFIQKYLPIQYVLFAPVITIQIEMEGDFKRKKVNKKKKRILFFVCVLREH